MSDFVQGGTRAAFEPVLFDGIALEAEQVIICSGEVYYDLAARRAEKQRENAAWKAPAIVRVEQIAPFPHAELREALSKIKRAKSIRWVQEEPGNQGAWGW